MNPFTDPTTDTERIIDLTGIRPATEPGLEPGEWVYIVTGSGHNYSGELRDRDPDGLTLRLVNADAEEGGNGDVMEGASLFVPWGAITSVLTGAEGEPNAGGLRSLDAVEFWLEQHRPQEREAPPSRHHPNTVKVFTKSGGAVEGVVFASDTTGIRLHVGRFERDRNHYKLLRFIPWSNVESVEWAESDRWRNAQEWQKQKQAAAVKRQTGTATASDDE